MNPFPISGVDMEQPYRQLRRPLLAYLRRQVGDGALAEDLLQEVFAKALGAVQRQVAPRHVRAWLYGIARNTVVDHFRQHRPSESLPEELLAPASTEEPDQALAQCLLPLMQHLPALYRYTVIATDIEGVRHQDLAQAWGVSVSAIKSRASRGRGLLKQRLLQCCRVELSRHGQVQDFAPHPGGLACSVAASPCAPQRA